MLKNPLIVGFKGNMAGRYASILHYLGVPYLGIDKGDDIPEDGFDSVIICTPTDTHVDQIRTFARFGVPILCEKPITKDLVVLNDLLTDMELGNVQLRMIDQYAQLAKDGVGSTYYNYFKHGGDGLHWDCINIIYHAKGGVLLEEDSPVWTCSINGHPLSLSDMDTAYIKMIRRWLETPEGDTEHIWEAHRKTWEMEAQCRNQF